jgi:hypothetical protein
MRIQIKMADQRSLSTALSQAIIYFNPGTLIPAR